MWLDFTLLCEFDEYDLHCVCIAWIGDGSHGGADYDIHRRNSVCNTAAFQNSNAYHKLKTNDFSEPNIRGVLTATTTVAAAFGMAVTYFLGSQMSWRNAAMICAAVPALSIILTAFV